MPTDAYDAPCGDQQCRVLPPCQQTPGRFRADQQISGVWSGEALRAPKTTGTLSGLPSAALGKSAQLPKTAGA
jgi:hypothetical protein